MTAQAAVKPPSFVRGRDRGLTRTHGDDHARLIYRSYRLPAGRPSHVVLPRGVGWFDGRHELFEPASSDRRFRLVQRDPGHRLLHTAISQKACIP